MKLGFLPLFLFLIFLPFSGFWDMKLATQLYGVNGFISPHDSSHPLLFTATNYGLIPGTLLAITAGLIWLFSFYFLKFQRLRKAALAIALVGFLGGWFMINHVVKEVWGRPRPKQIIEFGGSERFRPAYAPTWHVPSDDYKSFPSGHVAMGMMFVTLGLAAWKERWYATAFFGLLFGLSSSLILAYARMAHGAHFFSDVLTSLIGMWTLSYLLILIVYRSPSKVAVTSRKKR